MTFDADGDVDAVLTVLWCPIQVLNTLKDGGSLRPPTDPLDDPFFATELAAQDAVIDELRAGRGLRSADRGIRRS